MKKNIYQKLFFIIGLLLLQNCSNKEHTINTENNNKISIAKVNNSELSNFLLDFSVSKLKTKNAKKRINEINQQFDFTNLYITSYIDNDSNFISARVINNNSQKNTNINFVVNSNNEIFDLFFTDVETLSENKKIIKHYDIYNNLRFSYAVDVDGKSITTANNIVNYEYRTNARGCGQAVMDCITDNYSNHGWSSVALWIGSAIFPEVIVGVAAVCLHESNECEQTLVSAISLPDDILLDDLKDKSTEIIEFN